MGLTVRKLLDKYFQKWQLQDLLDSIHEYVSGNKDELIDRLIQEWETHGKNKYDLLEPLERSILGDICKAYSLDNNGNKKTLIKRIKKSHLLDPDFIEPTIEKIPRENNNETIKKKSRKILGYTITDRSLLGVSAMTGIGLLFLAIISFWLPLVQCGVEDQGLTYKNCPLGFQISRLNPDWSFQDIKTISTQYNITYNATLLGGVMVTSPSNTKVNVLVFDANEPIFSDIAGFAQGNMENLDTGLHVKSQTNVSYLDKNSALFTVLGGFDNGWNIFFKEKIEKHNDKVYVIQFVVESYKSTIPDESVQNLDTIYKTFGYLK